MMFYWIIPYVGLFISFMLAFYFIHFFVKKNYALASLAIFMYCSVLFLITPAFMSFSIDDIQPYKNYIESMPKEYTTGISKIYLNEGSSVAMNIRSRFLSMPAAGAYNPILRTITVDLIGISHDVPTFDRVIWHEVGHHVWYTKLTDEQRKDFTTIHLASIVAGKCWIEFGICDDITASGFSTVYSVQSVDEDFADSFMAYHFKLSMNAERVKFMQENLPNRPPVFIKIY